MNKPSVPTITVVWSRILAHAGERCAEIGGQRHPFGVPPATMELDRLTHERMGGPPPSRSTRHWICGLPPTVADRPIKLASAYHPSHCGCPPPYGSSAHGSRLHTSH